jgi:hypothetical protein
MADTDTVQFLSQYEQELGSDTFALLGDINWLKFTHTEDVQQPRST